MKRVWNLARVLRMAGGGNEDTTKKNRLDFEGNQVFWGVLLAALVAGAAWIGTKLPVMNALLQNEQFGISAICLFFAVGAVVIVGFSIPTVLNTFYMSSDLPVIIVMPYTPMQIVMARMINLCPLAFGISLVAAIPAGVAYSFSVPVQPSFYLALILAFITIPVIALSFLGIVLMIIMNFVRVLRNNDHLRVIGILVFFVLYIAYVILSQRTPDQDGLKTAAAMIDTLSKYSFIFPVNFALKSLLSGFSAVAVLEVIGITVVFAAVFAFTAKKLYLEAALSMQNTSGAGQKLDDADIRRSSGRKSFSKSVMSVDFCQIKRNPAYLMQGFLVPFAMPVIMLFTMGSSFLKDPELLGELREIMQSSGPVRCFLAVGIALFLTSVTAPINVIITSPVSREGESFLLLKQFPINWKEYIKGKQMLSMRMGLATATLYTVIAMIALLATGVIDITAAVCMIVVNLSYLLFIVNRSIWHDLKHPMLNWENEAAMLKKSGGAARIIFLLLGFAVIPAVIAGIIFLTEYLMFIVIGIIAAVVVAAVMTNLRLYRTGSELLENL